MARWVVRTEKRTLVPEITPGLVPTARMVAIARTESGATTEESVTLKRRRCPATQRHAGGW